VVLCRFSPNRKSERESKGCKYRQNCEGGWWKRLETNSCLPKQITKTEKKGKRTPSTMPPAYQSKNLPKHSYQTQFTSALYKELCYNEWFINLLFIILNIFFHIYSNAYFITILSMLVVFLYNFLHYNQWYHHIKKYICYFFSNYFHTIWLRNQKINDQIQNPW